MKTVTLTATFQNATQGLYFSFEFVADTIENAIMQAESFAHAFHAVAWSIC